MISIILSLFLVLFVPHVSHSSDSVAGIEASCPNANHVWVFKGDITKGIITSGSDYCNRDYSSSALTEGTELAMHCCEMPFSMKSNTTTKGFDPLFLSLDEVKQTCKESHIDLSNMGLADLGYCSKELGTL